MQQSLMWEYSSDHSIEYFTWTESNGLIFLEGTVLLLLETQPTRITYQIECDLGWKTRRVDIQQEHAGQSRKLRIAVDGQQNWYEDEKPIPFASGFYDIDLSISPSTNTLPIRRLGMGIGQAETVSAVWVRFPGLTLQPLHQRYSRLDASHYRYESLDSTFKAILGVDEASLVVDYEGLWRRVK